MLRRALGALPLELGVFGLAYPGGAQAAVDLLHEALGRLDVAPGTIIEPRSNAEIHPDTSTRHEIFTACGFVLFQEKQGHAWSAADGMPSQPDDLRLVPAGEVGLPAFLDVMARDRNDRHYYALCGPQGWARVMIEFMQPQDTGNWCAGIDGNGEIVGFVAVSAFDEPATATIAHIGVLPDHRGHGHGRRLVAAATRIAAAHGYTAMLSDVDVRNHPMRRAMLDVGHRDDARAVAHVALPLALPHTDTD